MILLFKKSRALDSNAWQDLREMNHDSMYLTILLYICFFLCSNNNNNNSSDGNDKE